MSLKQRLSEDVKAAMKARDRERLGVLRLVQAAIKQREVDGRAELGDADVLGVLEKMAKQRRESAEQYVKGGRQDLADQEHFELGVIQSYLPEPLGEAELDALIGQAIAETGAIGPRDMGALMTALRPRVQGRADMAELSRKVKQRLS